MTVMAERMPGRPSAGTDAGSGRVVLLVVRVPRGVLPGTTARRSRVRYQEPPWGDRPTVAVRTVIVTQEGLNAAFWNHLGETSRHHEEQQVRCDRVPEPVAVAVDQLHRYRCYRWPPGIGAARVYFLTLSGRLSFEPWSGLHPREADGCQPEG